MIGFCDKNNMILLAYNNSNGQDETVLTVAKRIDGVLTVVNTYYGADAVLMYKQIKTYEGGYLWLIRRKTC